MSSNRKMTAEDKFREAFERLKSGKPEVLTAPVTVSQNNIAKEANCDPSALRKSRYPTLVREIQAYLEIHTNGEPSKRSLAIKKRSMASRLKSRIDSLTKERDHAHSQLISARELILELTNELSSLRKNIEEASKINPKTRQH